MEYTRQYARYPTHREAYYCLYEKMAEKQECTIINISRNGMGEVFHKNDGINIGAAIRIEIPVSTTLDSISVNGMVKWVDKNESNYVGGIELSKELSDVKFSKLC
jgi:predicted nucleotidyltransferase